MRVYDNYEISGCHRLNDKDEPDPNGTYTETSDDSEAQFWTLYGHVEGVGVEAIGNFRTWEFAEQVFQRITGIRFGNHDEVKARLCVMHAGEDLLEQLKAILPYAENEAASLAECHKRDGGLEAEVAACEAAIEQARAVVAEAEGRAA